MSTFEKAKAVMLPTNEPSKIGNLVTYQKCNLAKVIKEGIKPKNSTVQLWNLYIISDDEIKENNTHFYNPHSGQLHISGNHTDYIAINKNGCKKIIATTDVSLGLPQPSQQFIQKYIEEYNKGNVITDVLVEYENVYIDAFGTKIVQHKKDSNSYLKQCTFINSILKVNPKDNTITIKKTKENYTKEEVIRLLERYISFLWKEIGIHYPISLGKDAKDKFINSEL